MLCLRIGRDLALGDDVDHDDPLERPRFPGELLVPGCLGRELPDVTAPAVEDVEEKLHMARLVPADARRLERKLPRQLRELVDVPAEDVDRLGLGEHELVDTSLHGRLEVLGVGRHGIVVPQPFDSGRPDGARHVDRCRSDEVVLDEPAVGSVEIPERTGRRSRPGHAASSKEREAELEVLLLLREDSPEDPDGRLVDVRRAALEVASKVGDESGLHDAEDGGEHLPWIVHLLEPRQDRGGPTAKQGDLGFGKPQLEEPRFE